MGCGASKVGLQPRSREDKGRSTAVAPAVPSAKEAQPDTAEERRALLAAEAGAARIPPDEPATAAAKQPPQANRPVSFRPEGAQDGHAAGKVSGDVGVAEFAVQARAALNLRTFTIQNVKEMAGENLKALHKTEEAAVVTATDAEAAKPPVWRCLELFRATPELLALPKEERMERVVEDLLVSSEVPFPKGALATQAPITCWESFLVQAFFLMVMGGPVIIIIFPLVALAARSWAMFAGWVLATVALALHPLPKESMEVSTFTIACYKYFSYRMVWVDYGAARKRAGPQAWCCAGTPHGVMPVGQWLAGMASNAFIGGSAFVYAVASVVPYTPCLRYVFLFGKVIDVSADTVKKETLRGNCVGLVADGIAGIFSKDDEVALKDRKGLAKLSLQAGVPILPAYNLGNTELYDVCHDSCGFLEGLSRFLRVSLFCFAGRFGPIPRRCNITTMLGPLVTPVEISDKPSQESVDSMHADILHGLKTALDAHKEACGVAHRELKFV